MKAVYIYNPHSALEVSLIEQAKEQLGGYVETKSVFEISDDMRALVRATPALILAPDYLQGEQLTDDGVESELLLVAELYKALENDEKAIHNRETQRLDQFIKVRESLARGPLKTQLGTIGKELVQEKLKNAKNTKGGA